MIFHSLDFIVFFVVTVGVYWALPHRWQNVLLLLASCTFYAWLHPWFLSLILATTVVSYGAALGIARRPSSRRLFLWVSVAVDLGLLGVFKYFDFFVENVVGAAGLVGLHLPRPVIDILLPVGISFYTFQALGYVIDVYRGREAARSSVLDVAVFVSFFPNLSAGPIMRASNLLSQVERERRFSAAAARDASLLIAWGFFKKLVVADNVGVIANKVFGLAAPDFYMLWAGVFAFAVQVYADFSAYTDIARGTARWLGFDLVVNFDHPYLAVGPTDFWRRWNISLTSWFRDYVFYPVGFALSRRVQGDRWLGVRADLGIYAVATLVTFLLSGLWHGASWNYVLWGGYHGVLLAVARASKRLVHLPRRVRRWLPVVQVPAMFALTCVGWLIFRETDLAMLLRDFSLSPFASTRLQHQAGNYLFLLAVLYALPLIVQGLLGRFSRVDLTKAMSQPEPRPRVRVVAAQACLAGVLFACILVLRSYTSLDFIYFQF